MQSLARNIGSAIGISVTSFSLTRSVQTTHADIAAGITPFDRVLQGNDAVSHMLNPATRHGAALLDQMVTHQAQIIAYNNDFRLMMLTDHSAAAAAVPDAAACAAGAGGGGLSAESIAEPRRSVYRNGIVYRYGYAMYSCGTPQITVEHRFELLIEAVTDYAIYLLDTEGRVSDWNSGAERLIGFAADEVIGRHYAMLFTEEDRAHDLPARALTIALANGKYEDEGWRVRKGGGRFWAGIVTHPIRDGGGGLLGFAKVTRDISAVKRMEERFRRVVEAAPSAMVMINATGRIVMVNAQAERLFGYSRAELLGEQVETLVPERFRSHHPGLRAAFLADPQSRPMGAGRELFCLRKDGSEFPVEIGLNPITTDEGTMVLSAIVDITTRNRLVGELERKNKELEAFTYSVSHDLRTPLRSIDGFSQALLEDCLEGLDAKGQGYLRRIRDAAQRMGGLIDDLLQLSRIDQADLRRTPVNLSALARQAVAELRSQHPHREVEVEIRDGLIVDADSRLMRILLENLFSNAWKFTRKTRDARIGFGVDEQPGGPAYFIRDNGAGFDMTYAGKLFGVFQRLHRQEEFPGTGIGLATVQRIVHRHGGRVWAEGKPDEGATFHFSL